MPHRARRGQRGQRAGLGYVHYKGQTASINDGHKGRDWSPAEGVVAPVWQAPRGGAGQPAVPPVGAPPRPAPLDRLACAGPLGAAVSQGRGRGSTPSPPQCALRDRHRQQARAGATSTSPQIAADDAQPQGHVPSLPHQLKKKLKKI